jgi:hypothetical protein
VLFRSRVDLGHACSLFAWFVLLPGRTWSGVWKGAEVLLPVRWLDEHAPSVDDLVDEG